MVFCCGSKKPAAAPGKKPVPAEGESKTLLEKSAAQSAAQEELKQEVQNHAAANGLINLGETQDVPLKEDEPVAAPAAAGPSAVPTSSAPSKPTTSTIAHQQAYLWNANSREVPPNVTHPVPEAPPQSYAPAQEPQAFARDAAPEIAKAPTVTNLQEEKRPAAKKEADAKDQGATPTFGNNGKLQKVDSFSTRRQKQSCCC